MNIDELMQDNEMDSKLSKSKLVMLLDEESKTYVVCARDKDIKSAVEWLKKEIYMPHATQDIRDWFNNKIDEAFEGVTK